jgi:hypothetical protein
MPIDVSKVMRKTLVTKIEPTINSRPYAHITKHLVCVIKNPLQENQQEPKKFEPLIPWLKKNISSPCHAAPVSCTPRE